MQVRLHVLEHQIYVFVILSAQHIEQPACASLLSSVTGGSHPAETTAPGKSTVADACMRAAQCHAVQLVTGCLHTTAHLLQSLFYALGNTL
jgi:hypothetical protein